MPDFPIQPIDRFAGKSAAIKRPREIAFFSFDDNHEYRPDDSGLRYYYPPTIGADLKEGFESFRKLDDSGDDHLDALLRTIMDLEKKMGEEIKADVVTWRGMMTKLLAVPYDHMNGFEMNATRFQGSIFIEENHAYKEASKQRQMQQKPRPGQMSQEMMSYWGYKFETLALIPEPWEKVSRELIENRNQEIVDNHAQYCSVVHSGIENTTLVLGGEVDAIWDSKPPIPTPQPIGGAAETPTSPSTPATTAHAFIDTPPIDWVELKTAPQPNGPGDMVRFERRLLKFWLQSFLLGVPRIIVGFRSPNGILTGLEELDTRSLPGKVKRQGQATWDGNVCVRWGAEVLEFLKQNIQDDGVYRIRRVEKSPVLQLFKLEEASHSDILSSEFVQWREHLQAKRVMDLLGPQ